MVGAGQNTFGGRVIHRRLAQSAKITSSFCWRAPNGCIIVFEAPVMTHKKRSISPLRGDALVNFIGVTAIWVYYYFRHLASFLNFSGVAVQYSIRDPFTCKTVQGVSWIQSCTKLSRFGCNSVWRERMTWGNLFV